VNNKDRAIKLIKDVFQNEKESNRQNVAYSAD
jgi:hypothetical protein